MSPVTIYAGSELSIYQVAALKSDWWAQLSAEPIRLDLGDVSEIDGAGVQLTLALWRAAHLRGGGLSLVRVSDAAHEALSLVGASALLQTLTPAAEDEHA